MMYSNPPEFCFLCSVQNTTVLCLYTMNCILNVCVCVCVHFYELLVLLPVLTLVVILMH